MKTDHVQTYLQETRERVVLLGMGVLEVVTSCAHGAKWALKS